MILNRLRGQGRIQMGKPGLIRTTNSQALSISGTTRFTPGTIREYFGFKEGEKEWRQITRERLITAQLYRWA